MRTRAWNTTFHPARTPGETRFTLAVLLRNTMINEWCYRDDDRYTMKASAYSPFSTLWKNNWRVFHGMENFFPRYGKHTDRPSPARSATPIYERGTPRQAL